jgi:hypothetical protein
MNNDTTNQQRETISRKDAKAQGATEFFTGIPCGNDHVSPRYVSTGNCVLCVMESNKKRNASGKGKASAKQWQESNPDRFAAYMGWYNARGRGATLPHDFRSTTDLVLATVGFYQEARRLTQETGKSYVVDHVVPLTRGGQHHPGNLRVISNAFNFAKRNMTDIECLEAVFSGIWKGPRDAEVMTILVESVSHEFTSMGASASIQATA